jgi:hypothetical protein
MNNWDKLKHTLAIMTQQVYYGFIFSERNLQDLIHMRNEIMNNEEIKKNPYCPTCGSCGKNECCPPSRCKFGINYIQNMQKELLATRKTLAVYIEMQGYKATEEIINQEINFHGFK